MPGILSCCLYNLTRTIHRSLAFHNGTLASAPTSLERTCPITLQGAGAPARCCLPQAGVWGRCYSPPALLFFCFLKNVPSCNSRNASRNCSCVFITIGPYHATGSSSGLPDTSRNRIPSSPACTINSSPRSNSTSDRLSASEGGGAVSSHPTGSVGTSSGSDALQNFPAPANTYANACRVTSTGSVFRRPGRHAHINIYRIRRDALHRPPLAPKTPAHHPHLRPVIVGNFR